jgi:hypothetical protein
MQDIDYVDESKYINVFKKSIYILSVVVYRKTSIKLENNRIRTLTWYYITL